MYLFSMFLLVVTSFSSLYKWRSIKYWHEWGYNWLWLCPFHFYPVLFFLCVVDFIIQAVHTAMKLFIETWELLFPLSNCANTWFIIITICGVPCKVFSFFRKEKTCMLSFDKKFWTRYSHDKLFRASYTDFYTLSMIILHRRYPG